ncbi:hypothetical protein [Oceaniradius stylonematis]|uniref:hypothetical protein n=1 Tax=Oceaniradius stylonematis TaxID=2184161 RepID=UPI00273F30F9|nr:hypothetical protein [Oceaniradius stylonematis]
MTGSFTYLEVEAALCVWEWINDVTINDPNREIEDWIELRDAVGSMELRHQSIELGQWCLAVFDLCTAADPKFLDGCYSYDWDIIPAIMAYARNEDGPVIYAQALPEAAAIAPKVMRDLAFRRWLGDARQAAQKLWAYADLIDDHSEKAEVAFDRGEDPQAFADWLGEKYDLAPADYFYPFGQTAGKDI